MEYYFPGLLWNWEYCSISIENSHMKLFSFLACLMLFAYTAVASIVLVPLKFELKTTKASFEEGEKITFILTITNVDKTRTLPIVTPGGQNSGKKLVYLRVYDPATNVYLERGRETRDMNMMIKYIGLQGLTWLKPGEQTIIQFYWNDWEHYYTEPASHHSFGKPLFAGRYIFQAFYDPFGNGAGDSLYNQLYTTDDMHSATKLNFLGPQLSTPCQVQIYKTKRTNFRIEGNSYTGTGSESEGVYKYYLGSKHDSNLVYLINSFLPDGAPRLEVSMYKYKNLEWLQRFNSGNIMKYSKTDDKRCPKEFYNREYTPGNEKQLAGKTDTTADGSIITIRYNENGTLYFEDIYSLTNHIHTMTIYTYKNGKLHKKKTTRETFKVPCEILLEIKKTGR